MPATVSRLLGIVLVLATQSRDTVGSTIPEPAVSSKWVVLIAMVGSILSVALSVLTLIGSWRKAVERDVNSKNDIDKVGEKVDKLDKSTTVTAGDHETRIDALESRVLTVENSAKELTKQAERIKTQLDGLVTRMEAMREQNNTNTTEIKVMLGRIDERLGFMTRSSGEVH
jgi:TolA-binding protein